MTDGIGIVGSVQGAPVAPVAAPAVNGGGAATLAVPSTDVNSSTLVHSPRQLLDPTAGFITQYLSANGSQVVSQTPSAITVAYLRIGLTADGLPKQSATPSSENVATVA